MTKWGHMICSLGFSVLGYRLVAGRTPDLSLLETMDWFSAAGISGSAANAPSSALGVVFAAGLFAGAIAPDRLEMSFPGRLIGRKSIIPHRTLTHSPWLWLVSLAVGIGFVSTGAGWTLLIAWQWIGFSVSGLLHLAIDIGSPSGIPLLNPFGHRTALYIYTTGSKNEMIYALALGAGTGLAGWLL